MFYDLAPDGMLKVQASIEAHQARLKDFHERGVLLMAGPYGIPPVGALGVFSSREAAELFAREDPFVLNGVVGQVRFYVWAEAVADAAQPS